MRNLYRIVGGQEMSGFWDVFHAVRDKLRMAAMKNALTLWMIAFFFAITWLLIILDIWISL